MSAAAMPLSALLEGAGVRPLGPVRPDPQIRGVSLDSRRVTEGDLFFALRGFVTDGERFVAQAVERGARAVLAASPRPAELDPAIAWVQVAEPRRAVGLLSRECFARPDEALTLVGVTGTNGKTTVVFLVEAIARAAGRRSGRLGTVGYAIDGEEQPAPRTTPEAPELFRLLAEMRQCGVELVSMEVSSHALALGRVEGARFAVAAFLNLGRDHLDFHRDEAAYFEAKARLFDGLGPGQNAVLPADDPYGERLAGRTRGRVIRFGRSPIADVRVSDERCTAAGSTAVLEIGGEVLPSSKLSIETALAGGFNLDNVAASAACALACGLPAEAIADGVRMPDGVPGRMERVDRGQPFTVLVDYAHTPDALARLLAAVRELVDGRVLVVFGCGGERDRGKRPRMGRVAAERADLVFVTSDNPRGEDPEGIVREIEVGVAEVAGATARCRSIVERPEAVAAAIAEARPGDAVVLAGKGHETTQTVRDRVVPQQDRELAAVALEAAGWR